MRLSFYGTKGYVEEESATHAGHSAFTVDADGFRLLCDFGQNRHGLLGSIRPDAIFLSHAHPDHAWGLREGTGRPVHASAVTHEITRDLPIERRVVLEAGRAVPVGPFRLKAYPVVHSSRCPCSAVRIELGRRAIVYSGDVISFETPEIEAAALTRCDLYVGDGSTLRKSLVRRQPAGVLVGHTTVRAQLGWLGRHNVGRAIFSHFGAEPIGIGDDALASELAALRDEKAPSCAVEAARDGAEFEI